MIALLRQLAAQAVLKGSKSMTRKKGQQHAPTFKAPAALAALKGDKTLAELAQRYDVPPNPITDWKAQRLERAARSSPGRNPSRGRT